MRFHFGDHLLDTDRRELCLGGQPVVLAPLVFDLLAYLVANRDRVVSKDEILDSIWSGRIVSESSLTSCVAAARRAIGDSGDAQLLIRTMARKGFRFVAEVRETEDRSIPISIATSPFAEVAATGLPLPGRPSIAVLAFVNMSNDPDQEYLSDGMADDIITELSQDRSLFVISRNSSFTYKGRAVDVKQIARELGVRYLLEGSIRRNGDQMRINAQLIEAETGNHMWAARYDRDVAAVFAVQDEITAAVTRAIHPAIAHAERQRAVQKPPEILSAWEAWHRALWCFSRGDLSGLRIFLGQSMTLDPRFAPAHAMMAFLHIAETTRGLGLPLAESSKLAVAEARTAIDLDPAAAIGHAMLAWTLGHQGNWPRALEGSEVAISLNPNDPWCHLSKAFAQMYSGRRAEAWEPLGTALRLDPRGPIAATVVHLRAIVSYFERDYAASEAGARRAIEDYPGVPRPHLTLAAALGQLARAGEARIALEVAIDAAPGRFKFMTESRPTFHRPEDHDHWCRRTGARRPRQ